MLVGEENCYVSCFGICVMLFLTLSEMSLTTSLCCHTVSHGATLDPSQPVIGPDRCKGPLLQNMSQTGEEEVGVESGKGQRRETSRHMSFCSHTL